MRRCFAPGLIGYLNANCGCAIGIIAIDPPRADTLACETNAPSGLPKHTVTLGLGVELQWSYEDNTWPMELM